MTSSIVYALGAEIGLITYRAISKDTTKNNPLAPWPVPAAYIGATIVFGALAVIPGRGALPATVFAWGLVLATALNFFDEETKLPKFALAPLTILAPDTAGVAVIPGGK